MREKSSESKNLKNISSVSERSNMKSEKINGFIIEELPGDNGNAYSSSKQLYHAIKVDKDKIIASSSEIKEVIDDREISDDKQDEVIIFSTDVNAVSIEKSDLEKMDNRSVLACSVASPGASGHPGGVIILSKNGSLFYFNYLEGDITHDDLLKYLGGSDLDHVEYLGMGNVLYLREKDALWLYDLDNRKGKRLLYREWIGLFREHYRK